MIINLTQHAATPAQKAEGVVDVEDREMLSRLLTISFEGTGIAPKNLPEAAAIRAAAIIEEFVTPVQVAQIRAYLRSEYEAGYAAVAPSYSDPSADILNRHREAATVRCMVGGMPTLTDELVRQLKALGHVPLYAVSERRSVETVREDGSVQKTQVFQHLGFVPA